MWVGKISTELVVSSMRPPNWNPPLELSPAEQKVVKRIRKAKLFVFLRHCRHQLFNDEFQQELATLFKDSTVGFCPVPKGAVSLSYNPTSLYGGIR